MLGYLFAGLWTSTVTHYYLVSLPGLIPAVLLGRAWNRHLHGALFHRLAYIAVGLSGVALLVQSIHS